MADPEPPDLTASNKDAVLEGLRAEGLRAEGLRAEALAGYLASLEGRPLAARSREAYDLDAEARLQDGALMAAAVYHELRNTALRWSSTTRNPASRAGNYAPGSAAQFH
jgi:hypothetical protein